MITDISCTFVALYYGSWISQNIIRQINGGELLLGIGSEKRTLSTLLLNYIEWNNNKTKQSQYKQYCLWLKQNLIKGYPCIITVYLDGENDKDYDHIIPVIGIDYQIKNVYNKNDVLYFHNLYQNQIIKSRINTMMSTRKLCKKRTYDGGCIPRDITYGLAITGITDKNHLTLPIRLYVNSWDEPNISLGARPKILHGTIVISNLIPNRKYVLLRYDTYKTVPTSGKESKFLKSKYDYRYEFQAIGNTWTFNDSNGIHSNGSTYYRCVKLV
ncbi:unnamed protein product [Didymodactylos carnosus]|uniref:Uncharacterized protein n=1 Tax=Didymodactylos carnosus TaxID=1234261 RepID=A0A815J8R7_9BILA|nr:unnamed protein product [Didymodactylos carnosus]CAF1376085.1 unnamed protein product [Didymodactylos carnosus]CAF4006506.1 unnamed protein product [Didymodactylos carnosus]CAF4266452.1 unnamed protein product [Didymodactylos carnosus]